MRNNDNPFFPLNSSTFDELKTSVRLASKLKIWYSAVLPLPPVLKLLLKFPHGMDIRNYMKNNHYRNIPNKNPLTVDECDTSSYQISNIQRNEGDGNDQSLSQKVDASSCVVSISDKKSTCPPQPSEDVATCLASHIQKGCVYYLAENTSGNSTAKQSLRQTGMQNRISHSAKEMLEALNDIILQINDGTQRKEYQAAVVTNDFSGLFSSEFTVLTKLSGSFRKRLHNVKGLKYSSIYGKRGNTTTSESPLTASAEKSVGTWIPGVVEGESIFLSALGYSQSSKYTVGCLFFTGKSEVNGLMRVLHDDLCVHRRMTKSGKSTTFHIETLVSNFPTLNGKVKDLSVYFSHDVEEDISARGMAFKRVEIQGWLLPNSICQILNAFHLLESQQFLRDIRFHLTYNDFMASKFFEPPLIAANDNSLWFHWAKYNERLRIAHPEMFDKFNRIPPKFCWNFKIGEGIAITENETIKRIPEAEHGLSLVVLKEVAASSTFLCTDEQSLQQRPFNECFGCVKLSVKLWKDMQQDEGIAAKYQSSTLLFNLRFYSMPQVQKPEDTLSSCDDVSVEYLVSSVWDRYVYNFHSVPPSNDLIPMLRPSWIGQMKMVNLQAAIPDNPVYVVWLGTSSVPDTADIQFRMALRIGMTTRPVELMRVDRFHDSVQGVKNSIDRWKANLAVSQMQLKSQLFPLRVRVYGVVTQMDTESEHMATMIEELKGLPSDVNATNILAVETFVVNSGWLYDCYHRASVEEGNEALFEVFTGKAITGNSNDTIETPLSCFDESQYQTEPPILPKMENLPLWGWLLIVYATPSSTLRLSNFTNSLRSTRGIYVVFCDFLESKHISGVIKQKFNDLGIPYKQMKHCDTIKVFGAIIVESGLENAMASLNSPMQIYLNSKRLVLPGYQGLPVVSYKWLENALKSETLVNLREYILPGGSTNKEDLCAEKNCSPLLALENCASNSNGVAQNGYDQHNKRPIKSILQLSAKRQALDGSKSDTQDGSDAYSTSMKENANGVTPMDEWNLSLSQHCFTSTLICSRGEAALDGNNSRKDEPLAATNIIDSLSQRENVELHSVGLSEGKSISPLSKKAVISSQKSTTVRKGKATRIVQTKMKVLMEDSQQTLPNEEGSMIEAPPELTNGENGCSVGKTRRKAPVERQTRQSTTAQGRGTGRGRISRSRQGERRRAASGVRSLGRAGRTMD